MIFFLIKAGQSHYSKSVFKFIFVVLITMNYSTADSLGKVKNPNQDQQEILSAHNKIRAWHHAPKLEWDDALADYAERHASQCKFMHSHSPYGENIAAGYPSISAAVNAWYAEHQYYSYSHPGFSYKTGHFTQLAWKESKKLGCAYVVCNGKGGTPGNYLVCEYSPPGNILIEEYFIRNVLAR